MSHHDIRHLSMKKRDDILRKLSLDQLSIVGDGRKAEGLGIAVRAFASSGDLFISVDGFNIIRIIGAESIEMISQTYGAAA